MTQKNTKSNRSRSQPKKRKRKSSAKRQLTILQQSIKDDRKQFEKSVRTLKRLGLAFSRSNPKKTRKTKAAKVKLANFEDVLSGKAIVRKLPKKSALEYASADLQNIKIVKGKAIIKKEPGVEYYIRAGKIRSKIVNQNGKIIQKSIILPVKIRSDSLQEFIDNLLYNKDLDNKLGPNDMWAFKFFGNNSKQSFPTAASMGAYFMDYTIVQLALKEALEDQQEIIEQVEILTIPESEAENWMENENQGYTRSGKIYSRSAYAKSLYHRNKERNPEAYQREKTRKAKAALERHNKLKNDPAYKEKRRLKAKERYAKNKAKNDG